MPQPYVILTTAESLDGRMDFEHPVILFNRMEDYRIQELRSTVDVIITSAGRVANDDPTFQVKDPMGRQPTVVIVDKGIDTPPKAAILASKSKKVMLVTCRSSNKSKIHRLQAERPDLAVFEFGENAVNLEDMVWELHQMGMHRMLLEGDSALNMRMLDSGLVEEVYVMVAPLLLGQPLPSVLDGKLDHSVNLQLEGILQYGDNVVLHYLVAKPHRGQ